MHSFIKFLRKIPQKFYPKVFFFPQADVPTKAVPSTPFLLFLCLFPQFIHILNGYFGKFDSLLFSKFLYLAKTVYKFFSRRVQAFKKRATLTAENSTSPSSSKHCCGFSSSIAHCNSSSSLSKSPIAQYRSG